MNKIEKIRQEIERLIKKDNYEIFDVPALLSFLDTLSEELDNDLEESAEEWAENEAYGKSDAEFEMAYKGFIAGAKWQAEQDKETIELAEDHAFLAGSNWQAEQFAKIIRANLSEIGNNAQSQFEQLYFKITGTKMYGGYND